MLKLYVGGPLTYPAATGIALALADDVYRTVADPNVLFDLALPADLAPQVNGPHLVLVVPPGDYHQDSPVLQALTRLALPFRVQDEDDPPPEDIPALELPRTPWHHESD